MAVRWRRWIYLGWLGLVPFFANAVTPMVAAGHGYALAVNSDGGVVAWGRNEYGQLGNGQAAIKISPGKVAGIDQVKQVYAGGYFMLALRRDGSLWSWGGNVDAVLGDGTTQSKSYPVRVNGIGGSISTVAACRWHVLALTENGTVWAWGHGGAGALGIGDWVRRTSPVQVPGLPPIRAIACGSYHSIALATDGTVWAWGLNDSGQLGNGTSEDSPVPVQASMPANIVAISASGRSNLALDAFYRVWAWGYGRWGSLGDGTTDDRATPVLVSGLPAIAAIRAGNRVSIASAANGSVWVWGDNEMGQFGDSSYSRITTPVRVANLGGLSGFSVGDNHVLANDPGGGRVWGWGANDKGQLGTGETSDRAAPTTVPGLTGVVQVSAGPEYSVALGADGSVWTWGSNGSGQTGNDEAALSNVPVTVPGLRNVKSAAAGYFHALALDTDGGVWAWGGNGNYELGDSTRRDALTPRKLTNVSPMTAVAAGSGTSFAIDTGGKLWSWGNNGVSGQLGNGDFANVYLPAPITSVTGVFKAISARAEHALALRSDGSVWAWGFNRYGQLGDGTNSDRSTPTRVVGLSNIVAVAAGERHSLALDYNGNIWAWGQNWAGELGDGTTTDRSIPVVVWDSNDAIGISAGSNYSCVITAAREAYSWGSNEYDQLGWGPPYDRYQSMSCGAWFGVAALTDGTVWAWGRNFEGQLGDGTLAQHAEPVLVVNPSLTGILDLDPQAPNSIPAEQLPPYLARATRNADLSRLSLSVEVKGEGGTLASSGGQFAQTYNIYVAASVIVGGLPVYLQLDSTDTWNTFQWPMSAYLTGTTLNSADDVVNVQILRGLDLSSPLFEGASIMVGYGTDPNEMANNRRYRTIFTVPKP